MPVSNIKLVPTYEPDVKRVEEAYKALIEELAAMEGENNERSPVSTSEFRRATRQRHNRDPAGGASSLL